MKGVLFYEKFIIGILLITFVISLVVYPVSAKDDYWKVKISDEVQKTDANDNGKKLIYVWREKITGDDIEAKFVERHGYSTQKYENEAIYKIVTVPEVTERVNEKYGKVYAESITIGQKIFDDNLTLLQYELNQDYDQFMYNKRHVISDMYSDDISDFKSRNNIADDSVIYDGIFTGSVIMYATDDEIKELAKDSSVLEISIWKNEEQEPTMDTSHDVIKTDSDSGTKSFHYGASGYKGTGVKIGIIEAKGGMYQSSAKQLQGIHGSQLSYVGCYNSGVFSQNGDSSESHATFVTSIIVGQSYTLNGKTYEGVVPNATAYQIGTYNSNDVVKAVNLLVNTYNVSVINYSGGSSFPSEILGYTDYDREIDYICYLTDATFVNSAGNYTSTDHPFYDVASPGKGYNVITVGNANTTTNVGDSISVKYAMRPSSCYKEASYLTNKPDVVAPGTDISIVGVNNNLLTSVGTSLSAPMVAGVAAQLHQANSQLKSNPTATKALILTGADPTLISTSSNSTTDANGLVRQKSGVGMLNAVNSVDAALAGKYGSYTFTSSTNTGENYFTLGTQYIKAGEKIRIALTFNKPDNDTITSAYENDIDLKLFTASGAEVAASKDVENNVEVIEYTATTSGTYTIKCRAYSLKLTSSQTIQASAAWRIVHSHTYKNPKNGMTTFHRVDCDCGVYRYEQHDFSDSFSMINTTYHYAYCACGVRTSEGHKSPASSVYTSLNDDYHTVTCSCGYNTMSVEEHEYIVTSLRIFWCPKCGHEKE